MPDVHNDQAMAHLYATDPGFAVQVLNDVLENGDSGELLITLRQLTRAFGGVQTVADKAQLNPTQLYRTLSAEGNPTLNSLRAVLKAMGLQLAVQPIAVPPIKAQPIAVPPIKAQPNKAQPNKARKLLNTAAEAPKPARKKPLRALATPAAKARAAR